MAGETDLHKLLKREACRWMHRMGYRCIAAEVRLSFEYFENQFDLAIDEVLLSGGGSRLAGLSQDLGRIFARPTMAWDPTGDLPIAAGTVDVDSLRDHVSELAVAVGLASRIQR